MRFQKSKYLNFACSLVLSDLACKNYQPKKRDGSQLNFEITAIFCNMLCVFARIQFCSHIANKLLGISISLIGKKT